MDQHESPSTAKVLQVEMMPVWVGAIPVVVGDAVFVVLVEVLGPATQCVFPTDLQVLAVRPDVRVPAAKLSKGDAELGLDCCTGISGYDGVFFATGGAGFGWRAGTV
jgi:hypothetical protein